MTDDLLRAGPVQPAETRFLSYETSKKEETMDLDRAAKAMEKHGIPASDSPAIRTVTSCA